MVVRLTVQSRMKTIPFAGELSKLRFQRRNLFQRIIESRVVKTSEIPFDDVSDLNSQNRLKLSDIFRPIRRGWIHKKLAFDQFEEFGLLGSHSHVQPTNCR